MPSKLAHIQPINHLCDKEARWFAINTKFRCEKFVVQLLRKKKIEAYVPTYLKTRKYQRKIKRYEIPLINSFVFVHINKSQYIPTLETEYVFKFLKQGQDLISIPDEEIDLLRRVAGDCIDAHLSNPDELKSGDEVEVTSGPLTGMKGTVIQKSGKKTFCIELKTVGYTLHINVDFQLLQPVHSFRPVPAL